MPRTRMMIAMVAAALGVASPAAAQELVQIDAPGNAAVVQQPFIIGGWAIDFRSTNGTGIDAVNIYAYPNPGSGTPPIFLGTSPYGGYRPDVAAGYGPQFNYSGYTLTANAGLTPGVYQIVVYAHSVISGNWSPRVVNVTVVQPLGPPFPPLTNFPECPNARSLGISGNSFTVNNEPKFLLFLAYWDAMHADSDRLRTDLRFIRSIGFDGVRIVPNWRDHAGVTTLFTVDGPVDQGAWDHLIEILDIASSYGLFVDLTFTIETLPSPMTLAAYGGQIQQVTRALQGHCPNVLFDLQNEFTLHGPLVEGEVHNFTPEVMNGLRHDHVRTVDPVRIVTASSPGTSNTTEFESGQMSRVAAGGYPANGGDPNFVVVFHDRRDELWMTDDRTRYVIDTVRSGFGNGPIYLQEPTPTCVRLGSGRNASPGEARQAAHAARRMGAAAWAFHTRTPFALDQFGYRDRIVVPDASGQGGQGPIGAPVEPVQRAEVNAIRLFVGLHAAGPVTGWIGSELDDARLRFETNGNLVLYNTANGQTRWQSDTRADVGNDGAARLIDGDLELFDRNGAMYWNTGTGGHPNAYIRVLNNGPLVIYDANDAVIWSSN